MSLLEKFSELEDKDNSYYYKNIKCKKPISNPDNAWNFIEDYFKAGEKESVLKENNIKKLKQNGKHLHTVSMYFMGTLMRDMFEKKIIRKLSMDFNNNNNEFEYRYDFTYTWFITCLFHDFSWIYEDDKISANYLDSESCFNVNLINKFRIKHNIFNHKLLKGNDFKTHYSFRTIKNYFYYRCEVWKKLDHGIIGGMLLYDRLLENYHKKWKEFNEKHPNYNGSFESFNYKN